MQGVGTGCEKLLNMVPWSAWNVWVVRFGFDGMAKGKVAGRRTWGRAMDSAGGVRICAGA